VSVCIRRVNQPPQIQSRKFLSYSSAACQHRAIAGVKNSRQLRHVPMKLWSHGRPAARYIGYREAMPEGKIPFDPRNPKLDTVRQIVIERLRRDASWHALDSTGDGFTPYVEYIAQNEPDRQNGRHKLVFLAQELFWQLVVEGILAPGMDSSNLKLPWFHVTAHGREVLASSEPQPYDPAGYLARLRERVPHPDPTVIAYLAESLETFRKNNRVASTVMLGIAAERVFLILCDALAAALSNASERPHSRCCSTVFR